jgi:hypothetical protein
MGNNIIILFMATFWIDPSIHILAPVHVSLKFKLKSGVSKTRFLRESFYAMSSSGAVAVFFYATLHQHG